MMIKWRAGLDSSDVASKAVHDHVPFLRYPCHPSASLWIAHPTSRQDAFPNKVSPGIQGSNCAWPTRTNHPHSFKCQMFQLVAIVHLRVSWKHPTALISELGDAIKSSLLKPGSQNKDRFDVGLKPRKLDFSTQFWALLSQGGMTGTHTRRNTC